MSSETIALCTLGTLNVVSDGRALHSVLAQPKRLALLVYLLLATPRGFQRRDKLLPLFWPELDAKHARSSLSQALSYLRRSLGHGVVLTRGVEEVGVDGEAIRCDVIAFEEALGRGERQLAVSLYAGPFLDGFFLADVPDFERWLEAERERLAQEYARALEAMAVEREATGDPAGAGEWWRKLAAQDPFSSRVALRLMQALVAAGEPFAALRHGRTHQALLAEELGVEADLEIHDLMVRMRAASSTAYQAGGRSDALQVTTSAAVGFMAPGGFSSTGAESPSWMPTSLASSTPEAVSDRSIAVLPFVNLSADEENAYFSDGLSEELINVLARLPELRVVARTSSFSFKGKDVPVDSIGRALNVAHVLEGSVRKAGSRVRITAQLVNAATGYQLWSQTYDRELKDIFQIQDEIARQIGDQLQLRLVGGAGQLARPETLDPEAHILYLKATHLHRQLTHESLETAQALLQQALQRDPQYAKARVALAIAYLTHGHNGFSPYEEARAKAREEATRALALDPTEAGAHSVLGYLAMDDWDWRTAEAHYVRALELNPGSAPAHGGWSHLLILLGREEEALRSACRAVELDPVSASAHAKVGWVYQAMGDLEMALQQDQLALQLLPGHPIYLSNLSFGLAIVGRAGEAIQAAQQARENAPDMPFAHSALAYAHARAGHRSEAERVLAELERLPAVSPVSLAGVHAGLGNRDKIFALLEMAVDQRDREAHLIAFDATFDPYRADPRMTRLRRRMGLS